MNTIAKSLLTAFATAMIATSIGGCISIKRETEPTTTTTTTTIPSRSAPTTTVERTTTY